MQMERYGRLASQWTAANGWRMHARVATDVLCHRRLPLITDSLPSQKASEGHVRQNPFTPYPVPETNPE
jgi:hypothetical protein